MAKCLICKKKINNMMIDIHTCKCKNTYCLDHISENKHNCLFDYKNEHKNQIKSSLPLVTFDKLKYGII